MAFQDYKISFGGAEYVLNSDDGGMTGSVFKVGADRAHISYAALFADPPRVDRFGTVIANAGEFEVHLESAVDAADNSRWSDDTSADEILQERFGGDPLAALLDMIGDLGTEPGCGECPGCLADAADRAANAP